MADADTVRYFMDVFSSMIGRTYIWRPNVPGQHEYFVVKEVKFNGEELFIGTIFKYPKAGTSPKILYNTADGFLEAISQQGDT